VDDCLRDGTWPARALDALVERALDEEDGPLASAATRAFFSIVIERLGDMFEPHLCDVYAQLFSHVIAKAIPDYRSDELLLRYRRIRQVRRFPGGEVHRVFVLSRVTLGADVAVTSLALAAAKQRFPDAEICFVGPEKNAELFAEDERIVPVPVSYGRKGLLRDRLAAALELHTIVDEPRSIVIDPDSRLTQLGLLPVCDDARYFFFESRAFGGELLTPLPQLAAEWVSEVFDVEGVTPYLAPTPRTKIAEITVSFGVGENASKRISDEFEYQLMANLLRRNQPILLDRGAGGEESARADALVERLGSPPLLHLHDGTYASFASHILQSRLYVGYDSAGQHVAAAGGIPFVSLFAGHACPRMLARWSPAGPGAHVVAIEDNDRSAALDRTVSAIAAAAGEALGATTG
jgi:ADP-heptose:LPS heptosyltransferase